jgi:hypothetical protein
VTSIESDQLKLHLSEKETETQEEAENDWESRGKRGKFELGEEEEEKAPFLECSLSELLDVRLIREN